MPQAARHPWRSGWNQRPPALSQLGRWSPESTVRLRLGGMRDWPWRGSGSSSWPECTFGGRQKRKLQFAVLAAAALRGGAEPDLLDEVAWWQTDDFWQYALFAGSPASVPPPTRPVRPCARHASSWPNTRATQRHNYQPGTPLTGSRRCAITVRAPSQMNPSPTVLQVSNDSGDGVGVRATGCPAAAAGAAQAVGARGHQDKVGWPDGHLSPKAVLTVTVGHLVPVTHWPCPCGLTALSRAGHDGSANPCPVRPALWPATCPRASTPSRH
jgi:hypothetical protein